MKYRNLKPQDETIYLKTVIKICVFIISGVIESNTIILFCETIIILLIKKKKKKHLYILNFRLQI